MWQTSKALGAFFQPDISRIYIYIHRCSPIAEPTVAPQLFFFLHEIAKLEYFIVFLVMHKSIWRPCSEGPGDTTL